MHPRLVAMAGWCREVTMPALAVLVVSGSGFVGARGNASLAPAVDRLTQSLAAHAEFSVSAPASGAAGASLANPPPQQAVPQQTLSQEALSQQAVSQQAVASEPQAMPEPEPVRASEPEPVQMAAVAPAQEAVQPPMSPASDGSETLRWNEGEIDIVDECLVLETCVDRYLWSLYQRAPKEDTIRTEASRQVTIKRKGKRVTVTRTVAKLADEDFSWKDFKAAERAGLSPEDYVIGGMDRDFKLRLFYLLHAAEKLGLSPGITSAFRDDYRQSIASGLKAADNRSYHGGSLRGGYGHGLAADIVSVDGATRADRLASTRVLWKWVDAHGKDFGIGRPYLDRDPPHVGPIDGEEYAKHRLGIKVSRLEAADKQKQEASAMASSEPHGKRDH